MTAQKQKALAKNALVATFAASLAVTGCAGPMLTNFETVATLDNGQNTWQIDRSTHGSNTLYVSKCVTPGQETGAVEKQNTDARYIGKVDGMDTFYSYFNGHALYLPACTSGDKAHIYNSVRSENRGKGENRPVTNATVVPLGQKQ